MKTFAVQFDTEIQAETKEQAVAIFAREYLRKHLPSTEVLVIEGELGDIRHKSASEMFYLSTPKTKFMWRMSDYNTFEEARASGAVYPIDTDISAMDVFRVISKAQECVGENLQLTVSER